MPGEGPWHRGWKSLVRPEHRERVIGRRRTDIQLANGIALELQHSPITADEVAARERDYAHAGLVWLFDAIEACRHGRLSIRNQGAYQTFRWSWARHALESVRSPLYLDLGDELMFRVRKMYPARGERLVEYTSGMMDIAPPSPCAGWGYVLTKEDFIARHLKAILL